MFSFCLFPNKCVAGGMFSQISLKVGSESLFFMPPFEEEQVYCFANVDWSVCQLVDRTVSADYLENDIFQSLHILHVDWSLLVDDHY